MMNIRSVSVLVICFNLCFASTNASFLPWTSSSSDDPVQNEKPQISLSCLLYGDAGCSKTCQLTALLYGCDTSPECRDNLYCFCNEVYHMSSGDLTTNDFQKMPFDELWDNTFENTSQANAIRRHIKKSDEMSALVDTLIRDPRVNGDEIKNQLTIKYPALSAEFKKLISVKRGMKSDLMTGDHLKYEDILDHFNELVTGIQNSNNELQNIKYRRRIGKILESIQDENELGHLVDLVKLSNNESLYNYVTTVLKKRGYIFDNNNASNYPAPMMRLYSSGSGNDFQSTNVIREHNLGVNDINEGDMIELSVITNIAQPANKDTVLRSQTSTNENNVPNNGVRATQSQSQSPNAAYTDGTSQVQTANRVPIIPQGQTSSTAYTEVEKPLNTNDNDMLSLADAVVKIQADLATLGSEVGQLKSASLDVDFGTIPSMLNSGDFMAPSNTDNQFFNQSPQFYVDLNGITRVLDNDFTAQQNFPQLNVDLNSVSQAFDNNLTPQQNTNFEENVSTLMNTLLGANGIGAPDASEIDFLNKIPTYMAQVAATPITFPDGVTVSKMMSSSIVPVVVPSTVENSVQYTISKKIRKVQDEEDSAPPSTGNSSSVTDENPNVVASTTYDSTPTTVTTTTVEDISPSAQSLVTANEPNRADDGRIDTSKSIIANGNFPDKRPSSRSSPLKTPKLIVGKQMKSSMLTNDDGTGATPSNTSPSTKTQVAKNAKTTSTSTPKNPISSAAETAMSINSASNAAKGTKVARKTNNGAGKEVTKNSPATPAQAALADANQSGILQSPSLGDTKGAFNSAVNAVNNVEQKVKVLDEVPKMVVVQSTPDIKKKKPQLLQSRKNGDQTESSVKSVSSLTPTENQMDNSVVGVANAESATQAKESTQATTETTQTRTTQTSTRASATLEKNTNNSPLEELVVEKLAAPMPSPVSQEATSSFGRFGLEPIRRFANSFKMSPGNP